MYLGASRGIFPWVWDPSSSVAVAELVLKMLSVALATSAPFGFGLLWDRPASHCVNSNSLGVCVCVCVCVCLHEKMMGANNPFGRRFDPK